MAVTRLPIALAATSFLGLSGAMAQPNYEAEAKRAMEAYDATGFTGAVMVDGEMVFTGAYGLIEEGKPATVQEDTLFPIASITKAFTTTALAILVDRGEVDWDAPLTTYIPEFKMSDPWITEHFTVRDALTHRSGLPLGAGDLLIWPDGGASVEEVIAALQYLEPTTEFRSEYAYDNLLYIVAGEVVARVSGKSWSDFVTEEILDPVGMSDCAADKTRIRKGQNIVRGHERAPGEDKGVPTPEELDFSMTWAAAGGIWCSSPEMMKWAKFWLDDGVTADGQRLISEDQFKELWTGVTPLGSNGSPSEKKRSHLSMYALGWTVMDFEGRLLVTHSGGAPGVTSRFILIPEEDIAIFASSNDYRGTSTTFAFQIADDLLNGRQEDSIKKRGDEFATYLEQAKGQLADALSPPENAPPPSLSLDQYVGVYSDPWYGEVVITRSGDGLYIDMGKSEVLDGQLTHYSGDQFVAFWPNRSLKADAFVNFTVEEGVATKINMKAVSDITDFSYDFHDLNLERVAD